MSDPEVRVRIRCGAVCGCGAGLRAGRFLPALRIYISKHFWYCKHLEFFTVNTFKINIFQIKIRERTTQDEIIPQKAWLFRSSDRQQKLKRFESQDIGEDDSVQLCTWMALRVSIEHSSDAISILGNGSAQVKHSPREKNKLNINRRKVCKIQFLLTTLLRNVHFGPVLSQALSSLFTNSLTQRVRQFLL